jgi:CBS-domain-containing membrane protein
MSKVIRRVRLRGWLSGWRARLSIPSLLAAYDEREVVPLVAAVNGMVAISVITLLAWLVDLPLLFPALGPSAFILFSSPFSHSAAPRSVIGGHLTGIAVGYATWRLVTLACGRPVCLETGGWPVLASASTAMALSCVLLVRLGFPHPPACGSTLIAALGAADAWVPLLGMVAGVVVLTLQAVLISRLAGVSTPIWSSRPFDRQHE